MLSTARRTPAALPALSGSSQITMDFRGASIDNVLNFFGSILGLTVVKDPGLHGPVTLISPKALTVDAALGVLETYLGSQGYRLERTDAMLIVRDASRVPEPAPAPKPDPNSEVTTRVFPLAHAKAESVARIVNELYGRSAADAPGGSPAVTATAKASADASSNSVAVSANALGMAQVALMITELDTARAAKEGTEGAVGTQVFELKYIDAGEVAKVAESMLQATAERSGGGTGTASAPAEGALAAEPRTGVVVAHAETNSVVVTAKKSELASIAKVVEELDRPRQVAGTLFVHHLKQASARDVADLLNATLGNTTPRVGGAASSGADSAAGSGDASRGTGTGAAPHGSFGQMFGPGGRANRGSGSGSALPPLIGQSRQESSAQTALVSTSPGVYVGESVPLDPDGDGVFDLKAPLEPPSAPPAAAAATPQSQVQLAQLPGGIGQQRTGTGTIRRSRGAGGQVTGVVDLQGNITVVPDANSNSLIINADPASMEALSQILNQIDVVPEQVLIEAIIVEASLDKNSKLGLKWNFTQSGAFGSGTAGSPSVDVQPQQAGTGGLTYTAVGPSWEAVVTAVATDRRFNVISTPSIFTANNQPAQINVSQQVPYIANTFINANGTVSNSLAFIDVGVILDVTPHITTNGYVTIEVNQEANDLQGFTSFDAPLVSRRSTTTVVTVKDGQTVVLGGLIRDSTVKSHSKVPILGDLPLIGALFRSVDRTKSKTELMVFLTPHVVRVPKEVDDLTNSQRQQLHVDDPRLNFPPAPEGPPRPETRLNPQGQPGAPGTSPAPGAAPQPGGPGDEGPASEPELGPESGPPADSAPDTSPAPVAPEGPSPAPATEPAAPPAAPAEPAPAPPPAPAEPAPAPAQPAPAPATEG